jgi:thiamine biosynthesis lipoprotein
MRVLILSLLLLFGCSKGPTHFKGVAHTHPFHIQVGRSLSIKEREEIHQLIRTTFEEIDHHYNHWNPHSDLSKGILSMEVQAILSEAQSYYELTEGRYDPTLGAPVKYFKQTGNLPEKVLPQTYDLDGMLKGFTIDLLISRLREKGYDSLYVEWGGDLRVLGHHPKGRPWLVLLDNRPFPLENASLATSGCEEQLWKIGNALYTHIINPHTLKMLEVKKGEVHQVSVMAPTCALADALATACMTCGSLENASAFAEKIKKEYPEVEFWITSYEL